MSDGEGSDKPTPEVAAVWGHSNENPSDVLGEFWWRAFNNGNPYGFGRAAVEAGGWMVEREQ